MRDPAEHRLHCPAALLGVEQQQRRLTTERAVGLAQPGMGLGATPEHVVGHRLDAREPHHEVALLARERPFPPSRIERAARDEMGLDLALGEHAVGDQPVERGQRQAVADGTRQVPIR